jgi:hypothetical protein
VAITAEQYAALQARTTIWTISGSTLTDTGTSTGPSLAQLQAQALTTIDTQAENIRLMYITPGSGQSMVYREKQQEAAAFLAAYQTQAAADAADLTTYPLISAEIGITAADAWGVAQVFASVYTSWKTVAAAIERVRLTAKQQIAAATTPAAVTAILSGISWPTPTA